METSVITESLSVGHAIARELFSNVLAYELKSHSRGLVDSFNEDYTLTRWLHINQGTIHGFSDIVYGNAYVDFS